MRDKTMFKGEEFQSKFVNAIPKSGKIKEDNILFLKENIYLNKVLGEDEEILYTAVKNKRLEEVKKLFIALLLMGFSYYLLTNRIFNNIVTGFLLIGFLLIVIYCFRQSTNYICCTNIRFLVKKNNEYIYPVDYSKINKIVGRYRSEMLCISLKKGNKTYFTRSGSFSSKEIYSIIDCLTPKNSMRYKLLKYLKIYGWIFLYKGTAYFYPELGIYIILLLVIYLAIMIVTVFVKDDVRKDKIKISTL